MEQFFFADFSTTISAAEKKLLALSEQQVETPRVSGKWTPKQIIGHLIDSASNNHQRFVRGQLQNNLVLTTYEQEKWVAAQHYEKYDWKTLVSFWKFYNLHLLHLLTYIPDEALKSAHTLGGNNVTLEFVAVDYLRHLKHHLQQIFSFS